MILVTSQTAGYERTVSTKYYVSIIKRFTLRNGLLDIKERAIKELNHSPHLQLTDDRRLHIGDRGKAIPSEILLAFLWK